MEPVREVIDRPHSGKQSPLRFFPLDYAAMVALFAFSSTVAATPICLVAISRELSLSLSQAGGIEVVRSVLSMATLLVSGFIGARFGKTRALGWSGIALGVGMFSYSVAPTYGILLLALAMLGVGGGVYEALINPMVQALHPKDSGRYLILTNAFWSIGILITMLATGELLNGAISWRVIMGGLGVICLVSGFLFLALRGTERRTDSTSLLKVYREKRAILGEGRFWRFAFMMGLAGAAEGAITYWSAALLQLQHGAGPRLAGFGVALFASGMIVARLLFAGIIRQHRLWNLLLTSALAGVGVTALLPLLNTSTTVCVGLFGAGMAMACFWPSLQSYAVDRLTFDPTGIFILLSCGGIAGFAGVTWAMGFIGDRFNLQASFWLIPFCLILLSVALLFERPYSNEDDF